MVLLTSDASAGGTVEPIMMSCPEFDPETTTEDERALETVLKLEAERCRDCLERWIVQIPEGVYADFAQEAGPSDEVSRQLVRDTFRLAAAPDAQPWLRPLLQALGGLQLATLGWAPIDMQFRGELIDDGSVEKVLGKELGQVVRAAHGLLGAESDTVTGVFAAARVLAERLASESNRLKGELYSRPPPLVPSSRVTVQFCERSGRSRVAKFTNIEGVSGTAEIAPTEAEALLEAKRGEKPQKNALSRGLRWLKKHIGTEDLDLIFLDVVKWENSRKPA